MDFEEPIKKAFEIKTIFQYDLSDFTEEEIEVIKVYCKGFKKDNESSSEYLNINKIDQPREFEICEKLKIGLERVEEKDLATDTGLRLRTYIYYEKFINNNFFLKPCHLISQIR